MSRVLVVEDDAAVSASLSAVLTGLGHDVSALPSAELALDEAQRAPPEVVLLDLNLPGRGGLEVLPDLLALRPKPSVIVITANPTAENAIDAMAQGASAHVAKPLSADELETVVTRVLEQARPPAAALEDPAAGGQLVGRSRAMLEVGRRIGALARSDCTVLIQGESGTGKELVARAIHERSARAGPFVAVSCAALPETLIEAELFGHEKGAFTGAHQARAGRVERAEGGTLFLDEVAELSLPAQAKLLRFLEERSFERVGESSSRPADVRVLAATNAPLERRLEEGSFREDLYFRLNVARLELPPLRDRPDDLPLLVEHFLARLDRGQVRIEPGTYAELLRRPWPGNVRELRNAVESALVALGTGNELRAEHLPQARLVARSSGQTDSLSDLDRALRALVAEAEGPSGDLFALAKQHLERTLVSAALEASGGNQVAAARLLGMNRATFRRKMTDHGLSES